MENCIINLAMDTNMNEELCISALEEAFEVHKPESGVLVHIQKNYEAF